jgi:putative ATPase
LNAVLDGIKELKEVVKAAQTKIRLRQDLTLLFVDEIHRWNKAQQDALLPHIESGTIRLIGATTENPFYALINPLLSRCQLFELHPLEEEDVRVMLQRALLDEERGLGKLPIEIEEDALNHFAQYASGDVRNALNALEMAVKTTESKEGERIKIDLATAQSCIQKRTARFDKTGDEHYHMASAMIKSLRGSDPDAALYWMGALLESGEDPEFILRRFYIFCSEDIGMAEPYALNMVHAAHQAFTRCGMPEGLYFLSHCCIHLALAPKSNSTKAIFSVMSYMRTHGIEPVPAYLKDKTANAKASRFLGVENASEAYKYPHSYPSHWVEQDYLPEKVKERFYEAGTEGREPTIFQRLQEIKHQMRK